MQGLEIAVLALVVGIAAGAGIGIFMYQQSVKSSVLQRATEERLQVEAMRSEQKDIVLRAQEEALQLRNEAEAQIREARQSLIKQEERLQRKEENLDRKLEGLERRERQTQTRERQIEQLQQEAEQLRSQQRVELERISALSQDEARGIILQRVELEAREDGARRYREIERFEDAWQRRIEVEGFFVCHPSDIVARESLPRLRAFLDYWLESRRT